MFTFKGRSNEEMAVIAEEENFRSRAAVRYEERIIDGMDGVQYVESGYTNVVIPLKIWLLDNDRIDDVLDWLTGTGKFCFNGRETTARFYDEIEPNRDAAIKMIETSFIRDPFWYRENDYFTVVKDHVINNGNVTAHPIIRLSGPAGSAVELTIGGVRLKYTFDDCGYVEVDCLEKKETAAGFSKSHALQIGFDYPSLPPGYSPITIHSGEAKIEVKRKDTWL